MMIQRSHHFIAVAALLVLFAAAAATAQEAGMTKADEGASAPSSAPPSDDPLGFLKAARRVGGHRPAGIVAAAIRQANLCATVDFSHVSVDGKRGIFEHEQERPQLLYAGDPLHPTDVDVRESGVEVQIDFGTPRSHYDAVSAYLYLTHPLRRHRGQVSGLESVAQALEHIAAPCELDPL